jgi:hypothetical protein
MTSSGMFRRVILVRTHVPEEPRNIVSRNQQILRSVRRLLVRANVDTSSPILVALMNEALSSPETSVFIRVTRRNIPEVGILR